MGFLGGDPIVNQGASVHLNKPSWFPAVDSPFPSQMLPAVKTLGVILGFALCFALHPSPLTNSHSVWKSNFISLFFLKVCLFIYLFLERGGERERNINVWLPLVCPLLGDLAFNATQTWARTGNRTSDPLVCRPALNPLSYTSQAQLYLFKKSKIHFLLHV